MKNIEISNNSSQYQEARIRAWLSGDLINGEPVSSLNFMKLKYFRILKRAMKFAKEHNVVPKGLPSRVGKKGFKKYNTHIRNALSYWYANNPGSRKAHPFYSTKEWKTLSKEVRDFYGYTCMCCGSTREDGAIIVTDHIKPRSKYPDLILEFDNMQVLCASCNLSKSNRHETDYRP